MAAFYEAVLLTVALWAFGGSAFGASAAAVIAQVSGC